MTTAPWALGSVLAFLALVIDQVSKGVVLAYASALVRPIEVIPVINLVLVRNEGVSFGVLSEVPWWGLAAFSLGVIAALSVWMVRTPSRWIAVSLGLVIGGATGNAFDRFRHGAVTDFIDIHIFDFQWPTFNLADAAIALGVGLLLLESVLAQDDRKNAPAR